MKNKNIKVPVAILSCFLIAFIIQGVLKLCGVLVFEKVLDWEIFKIIDRYKYLEIIYYSIFSFIAIYCLSMSMTSKSYSMKWWHYIIMILAAIGLTIIRELVAVFTRIDIIIDVCAYILVPFIVNITTNINNRLFKNDIFGIVTTLSLHIIFYLCYLGLQYWSAILNSIIPYEASWLNSSSNTLIQLEVYFGLITMMLTTNELVKYIRRNNNMFKPMNIASDKAKKEAKKAKIDNKISKLQQKSMALANEIKELEEQDAKEIKKNA